MTQREFVYSLSPKYWISKGWLIHTWHPDTIYGMHKNRKHCGPDGLGRFKTEWYLVFKSKVCENVVNQIFPIEPTNKKVVGKIISQVRKSNGKGGYPWGSTLDLYHHVPTMYGLYRAYMAEYLGNRLLGYSPKGTHIFPLRKCHDCHSQGATHLPLLVDPFLRVCHC